MKGSHETTLLLRNVRAVLPERIIDTASLLVQEGVIKRILDSPKTDFPQSGSTLDLQGLTLLPGFIDAHIHGAVGVDTMEATVEGLNRVAEFLASQGVTAWVPTLVPAASENYQSAVRAIEQLMHEQSRIEGEEQAGRAPRRIGKRPAVFADFHIGCAVFE